MAALTRAIFDRIMVERTAGGIIMADLSATPRTDVGPLSYTNDAAGYAIRSSKGTTLNPLAISDSDFASVPDADAKVNQVLDLGELRLLGTILRNWKRPDTISRQLRQDAGKLREQYMKDYQFLHEKITEQYKIGAASSSTATSSGGFGSSDADVTVGGSTIGGFGGF